MLSFQSLCCGCSILLQIVLKKLKIVAALRRWRIITEERRRELRNNENRRRTR